jgi:hypothetical protein
MVDTLLQSLRDQVLDEYLPLAGLLRKCLLLGAETGSESLRQWARFELRGYDDAVEVPHYRSFPTPPISVDSLSGPSWTRGQIFDRLQLPLKAREGVPESFQLRQPVEELDALAKSDTLSFTSTGLAYAQTVWNAELGPFQQIVGMSFKIPGSVVAGVLGQVRTQLVDIVAELLADTPLSELPGKEKVDAAVGQHIGSQYNTTIHSANGPTAIGYKAVATAKGLDVDDAIRLLDAVRAATDSIEESSRAELLEAVEAVKMEVSRGTEANTGEVVKKVGRLRQLADSIGSPMLTAATSGAVEAFTGLALSGAFG